MAIEERADPTAVQVIRRLVTQDDRKAVPEYIRNLTSSDLKEATAWFAKSGRTLLRDDTDYRSVGNMTMENLYANLSIRDVVTVMASSPGNAARLLPWRSLASSKSQAVLLLVDAMVAKGEAWCREFVAAAIVRNAKAERETAAAVIRHCLPLILHFKIPTMDLEAYPRLWAFYYGCLRQVHEVWDEDAARTYEYPSWGGLQFRIGPAGCCEVLPRTQTQLLDLFDLDDTAPDALIRCFDTADALAPLKDSGVGAALCGYVQRGTLTRADVLCRVETALSRCDGTPNQRLLAEVLNALKPTQEETGRIIPLLLSVVATAPGFMSFLALELLLGAPMSGSDLQELSSAVFARSEKKPQVFLVRHLKAHQPAEGCDGVLRMCWEAAAGSADLKIRSMAEKVLGVPAIVIREDPLSGQSLWAPDTVEQPFIPPYVAPEVNLEFPLPWWDRQSRHTVVEEQYLDRFLRSAFHAPREVREWYGRRHPLTDPQFVGPAPRLPDQLAYPDPETVVKLWASNGWDVAAHHFLTAKVRSARSGPFDPFDWFSRLDALSAIRVFRHSELALQAGSVPYSLATPSYSDFRVDLGRLVSVLNLYAREGWQYGEADFFQALLRLGPTDGELASSLPDIPVGPLGGSDNPERQAGRILRDWVAGGGFTPPDVNKALVLPVPLDRFPSLPQELLSPDLWGGGGKEWPRGSWLEVATIVPFWPDLGAVWHRERAVHDGLVCRRNGELAGATAGGIGLWTHEWLITQLAASEPTDAVGTALELAKRGLLLADQLAQAARNQLNAGGLAVGRLTRNLALVAYEGHLDRVWPALTALAEAAAARPRLPAGTDELLATCTELWAAIPRGQRTPANVPAEFVAAVLKVAGSKSGTKSALEAKRLAADMGINA